MQEFLRFSVLGIVTGAVYAVSASGLVVTYATSGIFNIAHGGIGMFMAFAFWELHVHRGWPTYIALPIVLFIVLQKWFMRGLIEGALRQ